MGILRYISVLKKKFDFKKNTKFFKNKCLHSLGRVFIMEKYMIKHQYNKLSTFKKIYGRCKFHGYSAVHTPVPQETMNHKVEHIQSIHNLGF